MEQIESLTLELKDPKTTAERRREIFRNAPPGLPDEVTPGATAFFNAPNPGAAMRLLADPMTVDERNYRERTKGLPVFSRPQSTVQRELGDVRADRGGTRGMLGPTDRDRFLRRNLAR